MLSSLLVSAYASALVMSAPNVVAPVTVCTPQGVVADTTSKTADTTQALLTPEILTKLQHFMERFHKEPPAVFDAAVQYRAEVVVPPLKIAHVPKPVQVPSLSLLDIVTAAAKTPPVEADLKEAGLTAQQYAAWRVALIAGNYAYEIHRAMNPSLAIDTSMTSGKNAAFIRDHQAAVDALKAAGMALPDIELTPSATPGAVTLPQPVR